MYERAQPTGSNQRTRRRLAVALAAASCVAVIVPVASATATGEPARPVETADPVERPIEVLDLGCQATDRQADDDVVYGVACRWAVPASADAAGVRLLRSVVGSDSARQQIFASRDLSENRHLDSPVRPERRYAYRVQALNAAGVIVASSRTVTVLVDEVDTPDPIDVLRLDCDVADGEPDPGDTRVTIGCRWSDTDNARQLSLWRSVDGGARELVASFGHPFPTSYRDVVPASTRRVVYAVIGTSGDGTITARSRAEWVRIPHPNDGRPDLDVATGPAR